MQGRASAVVAAGLVAMLGPRAVAAEVAPLRVKAMTVRSERMTPDIKLTGAIAARIQTNVAFRASGKVTARRAEVGQHVRTDEVLATLDPKEQQADVDNAEAALVSARAQLQQAQQTFARQKTLLDTGYATRASYDGAQETLNTSQAQVRAAEASLNTAREQLSYTELKAGQDGIIVSRSVEAGQVVQAGQTVFVLAQDGPRDAVFNVPEALLTGAPEDKTIDVALQSDPAVTATGTVREVSPILDPATSTVLVKIGLDVTPPAMALGAAVVGQAHWRRHTVIRLPWSALTESGTSPAVWLLDPDGTVSLRPVAVEAYVTGAVLLSGGIEDGQRVVTAGGQLLFPGQKVTVAGEGAP